jgi:hypothetical protein
VSIVDAYHLVEVFTLSQTIIRTVVNYKVGIVSNKNQKINVSLSFNFYKQILDNIMLCLCEIYYFYCHFIKIRFKFLCLSHLYF